MFPSSGTGVSGNFWGRFKGAKYRFALQYGLGASLHSILKIYKYKMVSMLFRKIQFLVFRLLVVWGGEKVGRLG